MSPDHFMFRIAWQKIRKMKICTFNDSSEADPPLAALLSSTISVNEQTK